MRKYKSGDKVVLEIEDISLHSYRTSDNYWLSAFHIDNFAKPLTDYTEPLEDKVGNAYWEGYEAGESAAMKKQAAGAEAAWELAKKVVCGEGWSYDELAEIFDSRNPHAILKNYTCIEAAAKVEAWEDEKESKKIKPGDVVEVSGHGMALVVSVDDCGAQVMFSGGEVLPYTYASMKKTDRGIWNLVGYSKAE